MEIEMKFLGLGFCLGLLGDSSTFLHGHLGWVFVG